MISVKSMMIFVFALLGVSSANAEGGNNIALYVGAGHAKTDNAMASDSTPASLGFLSLSDSGDGVFGFDIAQEGLLLDSTWGQNNAVSDAMSYNVLVGRNLLRKQDLRVDLALLGGVREETTSCPSSYIGFQCYADTSPDYTYKFNYGVVFGLIYRKFMLGARITGESTQALVGVEF